MTSLSTMPQVNDLVIALCVDLFINPAGAVAMAAIFTSRARARNIEFKDLISAILGASTCIEIVAINTGMDRNAIYLFPFGRKLLDGTLGLDLDLLGDLGRWRAVRAISYMISLVASGLPIFRTVTRGTTASMNLNDITFHNCILNDRITPHVDTHHLATHILSIAASLGAELPWQDSASVLAALPSRDATKREIVIDTVRQWRSMVTQLRIA